MTLQRKRESILGGVEPIPRSHVCVKISFLIDGTDYNVMLHKKACLCVTGQGCCYEELLSNAH